MAGRPGERGPEAVADMKNRLADGWNVWELWDRYSTAEQTGHLSYDYAEGIPSDPRRRERKEQTFA